MSQYLRNRRTNQNQTNQNQTNQTNQTNQNQTNQTNQPNQTNQNQTTQNQITILTAPEVAETKTAVMPRHREVLAYA
jgi:hypothetical protein